MTSPVPAQGTPAVLYACYVPSTGTVYRIDKPVGSAPGAPQACLQALGGRPAHVEFSWTDGVNAVRSGDAAGGDLTGTYPNPFVARLRGTAVATTAPASGQVLAFNGTAWTPTTPAAAATGTSTNTPNTLVLRDGTGNFAAGRIDASLLVAGVLSVTGGMAGTSITAQSLTLSNGKFEQQSQSGLVSVGAFDPGQSITEAGAGARLIWYPGKSVFRAGFVSGTQWDNANVGVGSVALGTDTKASGPGSIALGTNTTSSGQESLAAGVNSTASGDFSVALGANVTASDHGATALGDGTTASAAGATALGRGTSAGGLGSVAMGSRASTGIWPGSFVFGDVSSNNVISVSDANQFVVRASGGTIFYTASDLSTGVSLAQGGGSWASVSDRRRKELFAPVDAEAILHKVIALDVPSWSYKGADPARRYIGPTAQDFHAAFGLGTDTTIATQDMDGVTLAAVQALGKRTERLLADNAALARDNAVLRAELTRVRREHADLARRLARLETHPAARP